MSFPPFPTQLVNGADDQTRKVAQQIWNELNTLSQTNPEQYKQTIKETMNHMHQQTNNHHQQQPAPTQDPIQQSMTTPKALLELVQHDEDDDELLDIKLPGSLVSSTHQRDLIQEIGGTGGLVSEHVCTTVELSPSVFWTDYQHHGNQARVIFDLSQIVTPPTQLTDEWAQTILAKVTEQKSVIELIPTSPQTHYKGYLSVRFYPTGGAKLLVGPKVIHNSNDWPGHRRIPDDVQVEFWMMEKQLRILGSFL